MTANRVRFTRGVILYQRRRREEWKKTKRKQDTCSSSRWTKDTQSEGRKSTKEGGKKEWRDRREGCKKEWENYEGSIDFILWTAIKRQESSICILCTQSVPLDHLSGPYVSWSTCCMFDMQFSHILFPLFLWENTASASTNGFLKEERRRWEMCSVSTGLQRRLGLEIHVSGCRVCAGCASHWYIEKKYESVILKQVEDGPPAVWTDNLFPVHWFRSERDAVAPNMESKCTSGKEIRSQKPDWIHATSSVWLFFAFASSHLEPFFANGQEDDSL